MRRGGEHGWVYAEVAASTARCAWRGVCGGTRGTGRERMACEEGARVCGGEVRMEGKCGMKNGVWGERSERGEGGGLVQTIAQFHTWRLQCSSALQRCAFSLLWHQKDGPQVHSSSPSGVA